MQQNTHRLKECSIYVTVQMVITGDSDNDLLGTKVVFKYIWVELVQNLEKVAERNWIG